MQVTLIGFDVSFVGFGLSLLTDLVGRTWLKEANQEDLRARLRH